MKVSSVSFGSSRFRSLDDKIKFILPKGLGDCIITSDVSKSDVIDVLKAYNEI